MHKVYKISIIICILLACCVLVSCTQKIEFEDIVITGSNVSNLPQGTYTLRYDIENLDKFAEKHDYSLLVTVTDKNNKQITVENNRVIHIQAGEEYYVNILLSSDGKTKTHNYTVSAIKSDITVTFSSGNYKNFDDITRTVAYGGTLTDIPEVPSITPPAMEGHTGKVTKAEWDKKVYTSLTKDITVTAVYEYDYTPNYYSITYYTGGGTAIESQAMIFQSQLIKPASPTKDGFVFFDWYGDAELKFRFSFDNKIIKDDINLYARWIAPNAATAAEYFIFKENGDYYTVRAKDKNDMPQTVVIPNTHNGKVVTKIDDNAFAQCPDIKHITVPLTIDEIGHNAFSARIMQADDAVTALETVTFEQTYHLITIPQAAFLDCDKLTEINLPDSVTLIEQKAFLGCVSLQTLDISDDSRLIGISEEAFAGCAALTSVILPKNVIRILDFAFYNCTALSGVTLNCQFAPLPELGAFSYLDGEEYKKLPLTFYVPQSLLDTYRHLEAYSGYILETIPEQP